MGPNSNRRRSSARQGQAANSLSAGERARIAEKAREKRTGEQAVRTKSLTLLMKLENQAERKRLSSFNSDRRMDRDGRNKGSTTGSVSLSESSETMIVGLLSSLQSFDPHSKTVCSEAEALMMTDVGSDIAHCMRQLDFRREHIGGSIVYAFDQFMTNHNRSPKSDWTALEELWIYLHDFIMMYLKDMVPSEYLARIGCAELCDDDEESSSDVDQEDDSFASYIPIPPSKIQQLPFSLKIIAEKLVCFGFNEDSVVALVTRVASDREPLVSALGTLCRRLLAAAAFRLSKTTINSILPGSITSPLNDWDACTSPPENFSTVVDMNEIKIQRNEEIDTLIAILGDRCCLNNNGSMFSVMMYLPVPKSSLITDIQSDLCDLFDNWSLETGFAGDIKFSSKKGDPMVVRVRLDFCFPSSCLYPMESVFCVVSCDRIINSLRLGLTHRVAEEIVRLRGGPFQVFGGSSDNGVDFVFSSHALIFDIVTWFQDGFDKILNEAADICERIVKARTVSDAKDSNSKSKATIDSSTTILFSEVDDEGECVSEIDAKLTEVASCQIKSECRKAEEVERLIAVKSLESPHSYNMEQIKSIGKSLKLNLLKLMETKRYEDFLKVRSSLPAYLRRIEILQSIASNQIVVIAGDTGCGKTTQIPSLLLDEAILDNRGGEVSIIVTQPRRLSAIAVASRVAEERCEALGSVVGYKIRLEAKCSSDTRLMFCTTGLLLRRFHVDPLLRGVSHIVVDEVHERSLDSDFLLVILRHLVLQRPDIKIVLMSATINASLFINYFSNLVLMSDTSRHCLTCSITIPGRTFPVVDHFLEDVVEATKWIPSFDSPCIKPDASRDIDGDRRGSGPKGGKGGTNFFNAISKAILDLQIDKEYSSVFPSYSARTRRTIQQLDESKINYELIAVLVLHIVNSFPPSEDGSDAILIFLPGLREIQLTMDALKEVFPPGRLVLAPVHSSLTNEEQKQIFYRPSKGMTKVVVATNICETSITIEDCRFVIETGRVKEKRFEASTKMASLVETWVSKSNAHQRRGRAGRVREGHCFYMYSSLTHESFAPYQLPEILRAPLEEVCLQIRLLDLGKFNSDVRSSKVADSLSCTTSVRGSQIERFLMSAIEPPSLSAIRHSIKTLLALGALDDDESLTSLGYHLASLPVDPHIGKLIIIGCILSCLDSALTIAAYISGQSPWLCPFEKREEVNASRMKFAIGASDHLTFVHIYNRWREYLKKNSGRDKDFCWNNYVSGTALRNIFQVKQQLLEHMISIGFVQSNLIIQSSNSVIYGKFQDFIPIGDCMGGLNYNQNSLDFKVVKAALVAGLYPRIARAGNDRILHTKSDSVVNIHPSSIVKASNLFPNAFVLFVEKIMTTKLFLRECTVIGASAYSLLLFGGKLTMKHAEKMLYVDTWACKASVKDATLFRLLREELHKLLLLKIEMPSLNLYDNQIIGVICKLLQDELHADLTETLRLLAKNSSGK